jgi:hypothetical protein
MLGPVRTLFHFSDDPHIEVFQQRPVRTPSPRPPGLEWLNGPVVWAVTDERQVTYLFPRECPRILLWLTPDTTAEDRARWWGERTARAIAHVEWAWLDRLRAGTIHRYELPADGFEPIDGDWTWVARRPVEPLAMVTIDDLLGAIAAQGAELRLLESLVPLRDVWSTTLHASGIRLRNAAGWPP